MNQQAKDTFDNEASREQIRGQSHSHDHGQDAVPIEQIVESAVSNEQTATGESENLTELRGLAPQTNEASNASNSASTTASYDELRAAQRQAARTARAREMRNGDERRSALNTDATLHTLEDQGFTEDEALRLIAVTGRVEDSDEAREAAATLSRLRFTRWLVEQGKLDEWSV